VETTLRAYANGSCGYLRAVGITLLVGGFVGFVVGVMFVVGLYGGFPLTTPVWPHRWAFGGYSRGRSGEIRKNQRFEKDRNMEIVGGGRKEGCHHIQRCVSECGREESEQRGETANVGVYKTGEREWVTRPRAIFPKKAVKLGK